MERLPTLPEHLVSLLKDDLKSRNPDFNLLSESDRLHTFANWSVSGLNIDALAAAGLYYVQKDNLVRCVYCDLKIIDFTEEALLSHKCSQSTLSTDSPLPVEPEHTETKKCDATACDEDQNSITAIEKHARDMWLEEIGVRTNVAPKFPRYSSLETRFKSFKMWLSREQQPSALSEAGFFYMGEDDRCVCFHCGGGLRDWSEMDDPWVEHAHWFPKCYYVLTVKGKRFVDVAWGSKLDLVAPKEMKNPAKALQEIIDILNSKNNKGKLPAGETNCKSDWKWKSSEDKESLATCRICFTEERDVMFSPCRHIVSCGKCSELLKKCPVCRAVVENVIRVFHS